MSIERFVREFKAQDVGAHLVVHHLGKHTKVADWVDGNKQWVMNDAGRKFLKTADGVVESDNTSADSEDSVVDEKPKRGRKPGKPDADTLDLGDE